MKILEVDGNVPLTGTIRISGAKNSVVALIPAAILTNNKVTLFIQNSIDKYFPVSVDTKEPDKTYLDIEEYLETSPLWESLGEFKDYESLQAYDVVIRSNKFGLAMVITKDHNPRFFGPEDPNLKFLSHVNRENGSMLITFQKLLLSDFEYKVYRFKELKHDR